MEPPIPGGSTVAEITGGGGGKGFNRQAVTTLGAILANVIDIKKLLIDRFDPAQEELKNEEAKREDENSKRGLLAKLKGLMGGGGSKGKPESKSLMQSLGLDKLLGDAQSGAISGAAGGAAGAATGGLMGTLSKGLKWLWVGIIVPFLELKWLPLVGRILGILVGNLMIAVTTSAVSAIIAGGLLGFGAADLVLRGVDAIFGTDYTDYLEGDHGYGGLIGLDEAREQYFDRKGAEANARIKEQQYSATYINAAAKDPRMLPMLVSTPGNGFTGKDAISVLNEYEAKYGVGSDTIAIRKRIIELDPKANEGIVTPNATIVPSTNNQSNMMINDLNKSTSDLKWTEGVGLQNITTPGNGTIIAPNTTNNNTTVNNNSGNNGVRNNDPTLKAAERATMP
jgi:hypothetical protein